MGFSLRGFSSHEGVRHAVLRAALPVAGLVVALELAGAPAVVQRAVAAALLAQLHVIVDHLVGICAGEENVRRFRNESWIFFFFCSPKVSDEQEEQQRWLKCRDEKRRKGVTNLCWSRSSLWARHRKSPRLGLERRFTH